MPWGLWVIYQFKKFSGYGSYMFTAKSENTCSQDQIKFPGFDFCLNNVEIFKLCVINQHYNASFCSNS